MLTTLKDLFDIKEENNSAWDWVVEESDDDNDERRSGGIAVMTKSRVATTNEWRDQDKSPLLQAASPACHNGRQTCRRVDLMII
jgi:hypothetical protein